MNPIFAQGTVRRGNKIQRSNIATQQESLQELAKCDACGCDPCLGYWTNIDVDTGELIMMFIEKGIPKVMPLDEGKIYLKAKKRTRALPEETEG